MPERARAAQRESFARQWGRVNATDAARNLIDRTILRPAVGAIDARFADQPAVDAQLGQVLADLYRALGLYEAAQPQQQRALETRRRVLGEESEETLRSLGASGDLPRAQGKLAEAESYDRDAMEKCRRDLGEAHPNTFITTINTGGALQALGRNVEAVRLLDGVEPAAREAFTGANARWVAKLLTRRGKARTPLGSLDAAEKDLLEAHPLFVSSRGEKHKETRECVQALVALYSARQAAEPGGGWDREVSSWSAKLRPAAPPPRAGTP